MNISFQLTTRQVRESTPEKPLKDVTRRLGWLKLKPGQRLWACEKCQGIKPGEKIVRIREIKVVSVRREPLRRMIKEPKYGADECRREGFPEMSPYQFVTFFCESHGIKQDDFGHTDEIVTRIEFRYLP